MFYLRESVAATTTTTTTTNVFCRESEATATKRPVGTEINHTL
ncbi:hypothetical protein [Lysinibacillus sp. fls2-241-R2A-57]|nr:hypothetical protein [Lysinibacillus sp. fls2-241-R2A-57]